MNILIAADGSEYTKRMLAYLAAHDTWLDGAHKYTVVTAVAAVPPRATSVLDKETLKSYYADEGEKVLKPVRAFLKKHGIEAACVSKVGAAADVVGKAADAGKFDLLVMGSHGHGNLGSLVMGSVTSKVLAQCKTPVLVVR